jgi:dihydrofolate reductase
MDGYIARINGNIDWLTQIPNPENNDYGFNDFIKNIDAILIGRKTFETVKQFNDWPYSKPVFILSSTLTELGSKYIGKAEILNMKLKEVLKELENRGIKKLYIDGGKTIQSFLREDLLDEAIITTIAIVLGNGIPLFGQIGKEIKFRLERTEIINEYMVKNYYKRRNRTTAST